MPQKYFLSLLITLFLIQHSAGNVLFHLGFDFGFKNGGTAMAFNKSITVANNELAITAQRTEKNNEGNDTGILDFTTERATDTLLATADLQRFAAVSAAHLSRTRDAMYNLNQELLPLVGRNEEMAAKVKLITRYLNVVKEVLATTNTDKFTKLQVLLHYLEYVEQLERCAGGERTLEHLVMKLLLTKHGLYEEQRKIQEELMKLQGNKENEA